MWAAAVWTLVYDGECRFCQGWVSVLARLDRRSRLRFVPFQSATELRQLPPIPAAALARAMHLVSPDGAILAGAAAAPAILRLLPGGRVPASLFAVPGVAVLASGIYRVVARNRHRLGCGSAVCRRGG
jgi:predicted DCC family thiol-disulfide oxidoreductase YuxK